MLSNWASANSAAGAAGPVLTNTGITVAALQTLRDGVETRLDTVTDAINTVEITRQLLATQRLRVRDLVGAFNEAVRGRLASTAMPAGLPGAPSGNDSAVVVIEAAVDVASLWANINSLTAFPGFTPPLVLRVPPAGDPEGDPVALPAAGFDAALAELRTLATEFRGTEQTLALNRAERDRAKKKLSDAMRDYRAAIPAYFPVGDPIRESLPALYPAPGSTPAAVTATAAWDAPLAEGRVVFTASTAPTVDRYELRYCPGSEYSTDDEISVATTPAAGPLEFLTLTGLATAGSTALFRVYVITATGNEKGSNTVSIARP